MAEDSGDRTLEATPHRRQKAREEGNVAKSQDLVSAATLLAGLVALSYLGRGVGAYLVGLTRRQLSALPAEAAPESVTAEVIAHLLALGQAMLPLLGALALAGVLSHVLQTGPLFLPSRLAMDPSRIDPIKGAGRLFSIPSLARLGFGLFKIAVVATVAAVSLWTQREQIVALVSLAPPAIAAVVCGIAIKTCLQIAVALLALALLDYWFQRWKHEQDLRMTVQEVRDEMKTLEGDPQIMARRRAVQRQLAAQRMKSAVQEASVVVTNPTELAIALKYDVDTMPAPVVVAKGAGALAQRIRRLALEHNVPILERKPLAQALYKDVEIGQAIPPEQYAAVAEVLRYVYELQGKPLPQLRRAS